MAGNKEILGVDPNSSGIFDDTLDKISRSKFVKVVASAIGITTVASGCVLEKYIRVAQAAPLPGDSDIANTPVTVEVTQPPQSDWIMKTLLPTITPTIFPTGKVVAVPKPPTPVDCNSKNHEFDGVHYYIDENGQTDGIVAIGKNGSRFNLDINYGVFFIDGSVVLLTNGRKSRTPSGFAFKGPDGKVIENGTIGYPISGPVCPRPKEGAIKGFSRR